ncbi:MAG: class I SAM-dependent methyltransferase [Treponema sp.]|jgi:23S rRNA G2069 N7-methylase RlmK/C1962 C5-methylase RlmI|nr:class I SAM-dependent methyltransferase [Treponema sp.]
MPADQGKEKTAFQGEMLRCRLKKRFRHLKKWANRSGTGAFRLYDRDIPEIPLLLDIYGDAVSGALYKRPYEKDAAEEALWLEAMKAAASKALEIPAARIFFKERSRQKGSAQYEKAQESRNFTLNINEGGLRFRVNLSDYLDAGLFPDRRLLRSLVRSEAAGKRVLNLFCYTASFSVCAAAGGAREVDSVDMSRTYLEWAAANFALNGFSARMIQARDMCKGGGPAPFRLIRGDALNFMAEAHKARLAWDLIVLDPPAFSNSKSMNGVLDLRRDHLRLITLALGLLKPGGKLWFSASARRFHLEAETFSGTAARDITEQLRDEDFKGKKIPVCCEFTLL